VANILQEFLATSTTIHVNLSTDLKSYVLTLKNSAQVEVFWVVTPCSVVVGYRRPY